MWQQYVQYNFENDRDAQVDVSWLAQGFVPKDHNEAVHHLQHHPNPIKQRSLNRDRSLKETPVDVIAPDQGAKWPMDSWEPPPCPPP